MSKSGGAAAGRAGTGAAGWARDPEAQGKETRGNGESLAQGARRRRADSGEMPCCLTTDVSGATLLQKINRTSRSSVIMTYI